jgi:hypothetical protein
LTLREDVMEYRTLGRTGIKVSPYGLGTLMLGASIGNPDHDDSIRLIHKAPDAGINLVDTADAYSRGESEIVVGKALKGRHDDVVLATKVSLPMGDEPNQRGASRRWIMAAVEGSLRRLQTDYIDLYQIQRPDPDTEIEETLSALTDLIRSGKVRAIGSSTTPASQIVEASPFLNVEDPLAAVCGTGRGRQRGAVGCGPVSRATTTAEATRTCSRCGVTQPTSAFPRSPNCIAGRAWVCSPCDGERKRFAEQHPDLAEADRFVRMAPDPAPAIRMRLELSRRRAQGEPSSTAFRGGGDRPVAW